MAGHVPHLRLAPPPPDAGRRDLATGEKDWLAAGLLLVGLVPLLGYALLRRWPSWELGAGAAMTLFALRQLVRGTRSAV